MFRKKQTGLKIAKALFWLLLILGILAGGGYYLTHYVDEYRVLYKRLKAENKYVFDEIDPRFLVVNPADLITIDSKFDVVQKRQKLITAIWGEDGFPTDVQPSKVEVVEAVAGLNVIGVGTIERLEIDYEFGLKAVTYVLEPVNWNGRVLMYQHGYAGTFHQMRPRIQQLLDEGFLVGLSNFIAYGENRLPGRIDHPKFGNIDVGYDGFSYAMENPIKVYVNPAVLTLNHIHKTRDVIDANMLGFSAGGWITTLTAAVDERISKSFAVASIYPLYLRTNLHSLRDAPPIQLYGPLLHASNYLDMFIMAASGTGRHYTQIFNQYDRCCYRNRKGKLYEKAVQEALATTYEGTFEVLIDTTHADHQVSDWGMAEVLARLKHKAN